MASLQTRTPSRVDHSPPADTQMLWLAGGAHVCQEASGLLPAATQQPVARLRPRPRARGRSSSCPLPGPEICPTSNSRLIDLDHHHHCLVSVSQSFSSISSFCHTPLILSRAHVLTQGDEVMGSRLETNVVDYHPSDELLEDQNNKAQ